MRTDIQAFFKKDITTLSLYRITLLSFLFVIGCLPVSSQVYVSSGTRLFIENGATIFPAVKDTLLYFSDSQAKIYITNGTIVKNLTKQTDFKNIIYPEAQTQRVKNKNPHHRFQPKLVFKEKKAKTKRIEKSVRLVIKTLPLKESLTSIQDRTLVANDSQQTLLKVIVAEAQPQKVISYYYRRKQIYLYRGYSSNSQDTAFLVRPPPFCV